MRHERRWPLAWPVESLSRAAHQDEGARFAPTLPLIGENVR